MMHLPPVVAAYNIILPCFKTRSLLSWRAAVPNLHILTKCYSRLFLGQKTLARHPFLTKPWSVTTFLLMQYLGSKLWSQPSHPKITKKYLIDSTDLRF